LEFEKGFLQKKHFALWKTTKSDALKNIWLRITIMSTL